MDEFKRRTGVISAAIAFALVAGLAPATGIAADFSGKRVELVVASSEGSGTDRFARIFQPFLEKHLPGNPTVVVANRPGGSGIVAGNWFDRNAENDGTTLIVTGGSVPVSFVFAGDKVKFDMVKWNPVVLAPFGICYLARVEQGVTGEDAAADVMALRKSGELKFGAKNSTSSELLAFMIFDLLGIDNVSPVFGLESGESRQATQRGELEMNQDSSLKCVSERESMDQYGIKVILTAGLADADGNVVRDPLFPDSPHVGEVYEAVNGSAPSGPQWESVKYLINMIIMANKGLFLPADASDDVRQTYAAAMDTIFADEEFKEATKKTFGGYPQAFGDEAKKILANGVDVPAATKEWMLEWIGANLTEGS
jgi:tripartite-type tricarboxylate transporter receptor subunit TctC